MRIARPCLLLCSVLPWLAATPARAGEQGHAHGHAHDHARELDEVVVTATPIRQAPDDITRPTEVLSGTGLDDSRAATLGESVGQLPGVQSSFFGAGVGRPVIRGLDGARVQVLGEGLAAMDASTVSVDHAVTIEPFLADQIEVLKGPATLLFGSGAVGGAVNVVDGRIHEHAFEGTRGRVELRGNDVADERAGAVRIDAGHGHLVLHADAYHRETGDYAIPGPAGRSADRHDHGHAGDHAGGHDHDEGVLPHSATRTRGGAIGASHATARGFAGIAVSRHESRYGVPGHSHDHGDDHHDHRALSPMNLSAAHDNGHDQGVAIDLRQTRIDAKAGLDDPLPGHETLRLRLGHARYAHTEFEDGIAGTHFHNEGHEGRIELVHAPLADWHGAWGLQASRRDFTAEGEEAFVPPSVTRDLGLFLLERRHWERLKLEIGARHDRVHVEPQAGMPARRFHALSASLATEWRISDHWHMRLGMDRAQRAPTAEELYSDGVHVATASHEVGDASLGVETSRQVELGLHYHGDRWDMRIAAWRNRFDRFTYLRHDDEAAHAHGGHEDDFPVLFWRQHDATFRGGEIEARLKLAEHGSGRYTLRVMADTVRAELDAGGNLPRIAPARVGTGLDWSHGGWRAGVTALRYRRQDRVAEHETPTPGYTQLDADASWSFEWQAREVELFLQGRNLLDEDIRVHTSFLKDVAPRPGRSLAAGIRAWF
ncbi:TonB-dependent receptor [Pseudofulvimonas gallinarii]|uniref:Iron complex outermembrane receptor protein n=2 Tax=Pseudofulvimonas gallinarii TaxID=634155 RepID=A0A4S3KZ52_9GAMM|nr:TonB-dependent receptor [Pseudofulvimonas gallinarii]TCS99294.1 iron complex outermembrane receptor protein [Pseudofulvimonas gallinarii]THD13908.1 hypothetical protein B1808_05305 [Pseudofulvimonas gallinarii]